MPLCVNVQSEKEKYRIVGMLLTVNCTVIFQYPNFTDLNPSSLVELWWSVPSDQASVKIVLPLGRKKLRLKVK